MKTLRSTLAAVLAMLAIGAAGCTVPNALGFPNPLYGCHQNTIDPNQSIGYGPEYSTSLTAIRGPRLYTESGSCEGDWDSENQPLGHVVLQPWEVWDDAVRRCVEGLPLPAPVWPDSTFVDAGYPAFVDYIECGTVLNPNTL